MTDINLVIKCNTLIETFCLSLKSD